MTARASGGARVTRRNSTRASGNSARTRASGTPRTSALRGLSTMKSYQRTPPPGSDRRPHRPRQALLVGVVEQRREHRRLQHDVDARRRDRHGRRVAADQGHGRGQARARARVALGEQLDAAQALGREAEAQQAEQVAAAAAADLEQRERREVAQADADEQAHHRPLALVQGGERSRLCEAVARVDGGTARIALAHGAGFVALVGRVAHRVNVE